MVFQIPQTAATPVRMGAAGAMAAVTMLWIGGMSAAWFHAGTVLLLLCLVPLTLGLKPRAGVFVGLLFGVLWIAAGLGFAPQLESRTVFAPLNLAVMALMMTVGGLCGAWSCRTTCASVLPSPTDSVSTSDAAFAPGRSTEASTAGGRLVAAAHEAGAWGKALAVQREWLTGWDRNTYPWTSFDQHIREVVRLLTGMKRLRCYRVSERGLFYPLNGDRTAGPVEVAPRDLLNHVVLTGRRYAAHISSSGPLVQTLAGGRRRALRGPCRFATATSPSGW